MRILIRSRQIACSAITAGVMLTSVSIAAHATPVTFFGEDVTGNNTPALLHPKADAARDDLFSHLTSVGTETFESFVTGTNLPLTISFAGGTAMLSGDGTITSGATSSNQFPISGSKFVEAVGTLTATTSIPTAAFGFYATDLGDGDGQLSVTLTDVNKKVTTFTPGNVTGTPGDGSALFFGFYDPSDTYTSVSIAGAAGSDTVGFDDFSVGSVIKPPSTVPLPASAPMFGVALVALGAIGYGVKRKKAAAAA